MPLPTNPEQEAVARRLAEHRGVTVQGPPGTGKTHTIANLISHLVGHGKRVLVTSQKEQALAVLRDKIPESVRDLSVAVLGSSAASLAQLEQSVQAIYEHAVALDRAAARRGSRELEARLSELQREIGALRTRISASIARERDSYAVGTATHTPSTLGKWLAANAADLGYIPDDIEPSVTCPLTGAEIADLFRLARGDPADCARARLQPARRGATPITSRNWRRPPPSCATYETASPGPKRHRGPPGAGAARPRRTFRPDRRGRAGRQAAGATGAAVAGGGPRRAADRRVRRDLAGPDESHREGIEELAAWQAGLLGHRSFSRATASRRRS